MNLIHHWIYEDFWIPLWPNILASILIGIVVYYWKGRKWLKRHAEHQKKIAEIHSKLIGNDK